MMLRAEFRLRFWLYERAYVPFSALLASNWRSGGEITSSFWVKTSTPPLTEAFSVWVEPWITSTFSRPLLIVRYTSSVALNSEAVWSALLALYGLFGYT